MSCIELIEVNTKEDLHGSLSIIEDLKDVPFQIRRIYYIHSLKKTDTLVRGKHAHKELHQVFIAIHGEFDLTIDDGEQSAKFHLKDPTEALYLKPGYWRELTNFSPDAVCLVLASDHYVESDYIRDYQEFINWKKSHS